MADEVKAPVVESKETKPAAEAEANPEKAAETAGELLGDKPKKTDDVKTVPESALIEIKKENKQLFKEIKKMQELIADGATKKDTAASLKAIAAKHDVSEEFLSELASAIKAETDAEVDEKVQSRLKPIEEKDNAARIDKIFNEHFDRTLEQMPEYKDIANRAVIKSLTLDPANRDKTFAQILESAYGHLIQGKRTMEAAKPRGGKEPAGVDFDKARSDTTYFKEIMADPALRKEYNSDLHKRLRL